VTLGSGRTLGTPSNASLGQFYTLRVNNGSGAYALTCPTGVFNFGGYGAPPWPAVSGVWSKIWMQCDQVSPPLFSCNFWPGA
jgi:hypothetical protein